MWENYRPTASNWQTYQIMLYRVHLVMKGFELTITVVIGSDCTGSCKSNYQPYDHDHNCPDMVYKIYAWLFNNNVIFTKKEGSSPSYMYVTLAVLVIPLVSIRMCAYKHFKVIGFSNFGTYRCCNGLRARLEWRRSWVRAPTIKLLFVSLSAKYSALRRKSKYWCARNQDNVYE